MGESIWKEFQRKYTKPIKTYAVSHCYLFESDKFYLNMYFLMFAERKTPDLVRILSVSELPRRKVKFVEY